MSPIKKLHYFDARFCAELCGHWNEKWLEIWSELRGKNRRSPSNELESKIRNVTFRIEMTDNSRRYAEYFDSLVEDNHSAFGEITPSYSILPSDGFSAIKKIYPQAKFIFIMRDPVSRYLSQIRFISQLRLVEGKTPLKGFDANATAVEYLSKTEYVTRGDYQRTVETLLRATGEDSVCILFYEHLFDSYRQSSELQILCGFLGVEFRPSHNLEKINETQKFEFDEGAISEVRRHFSSTYEFVDRKFGKIAPESWNWD